jgi:hypothetical protein
LGLPLSASPCVLYLLLAIPLFRNTFLDRSIDHATGLPFSFGLFQDFYSRHEPFKSDPDGIAAIGTTALVSISALNLAASDLLTLCPIFKGIMYLGGPFCFVMMHRWLFVRKWSAAIGTAIMVVSLIASSWATQVWHLVMTQGVLYAIGGSFLYFRVILSVDDWFIRRKGLAYGVMWVS